MKDDARLTFHPAADTFPLMNEAELKELAADIKAHGQIDPIWTLDGMIIIGRNRFNACRVAGIEPRIEAFKEGWNGDPLTLVISSNRHRRHWTPAQLAWIGLSLAEPTRDAFPKSRADNTDRAGETEFSSALPSRARARHDINKLFEHDTGRSSTSVGESPPWFKKWRKPEMTHAEAAHRMSINIDQIRTAADVKKVALAGIVDAIKDGRIRTIGHAYSIVTPDKDEKRDGVLSGHKQRAWLADPRNMPRKPRQRTTGRTIEITDRALKALSDARAAAITEILLPKTNRALALEGRRLQYVPIKVGS
jgi:hypothetical protein